MLFSGYIDGYEVNGFLGQLEVNPMCGKCSQLAVNLLSVDSRNGEVTLDQRNGLIKPIPESADIFMNKESPQNAKLLLHPRC